MSSSLKYQHYISSANRSFSIDISIFWGAQFKKTGTVGKWCPIQKIWISHFFGQSENLAPRQVEIPK